MNFTSTEKLMTLMLCSILEKLNADDKAGVNPEFIRQVIDSDNTWAIPWKYPLFKDPDEKSPAEVLETCDILAMWERLEDSYAGFDAAQRAKLVEAADPFGRDVRFRGFDGNNEGPHISAARCLVEELGRFSKFSGRDLDAHMPMIEEHRRMLRPWKEMRLSVSNGDLSVEQIAAILQEKVHPSNR